MSLTTEWSPTSRASEINPTESNNNKKYNPKRSRKSIPADLVVDNKLTQSLSSLTGPTANTTSDTEMVEDNNDKWKEELETLKETITTTIMKELEEKVEKTMESKMKDFNDKLQANSENNEKIANDMGQMKKDIDNINENMKLELKTNREEMHSDIDGIRKDIERNDEKNGSKLDALLMLFSS
jgi:hypothetical protein